MRKVLRHGLSYTPEYRAWQTIRHRCTQPTSPAWHRYGGRGITLHAPWINDPTAFIAHVGKRPSPKHEIDRINNDRGYEPGNLRWVTRIENSRNRRSNHYLTFRGETLTVAEWADRVGLPRAALMKRIEKGWAVDQALTVDVMNRGPIAASKRVHGTRAKYAHDKCRCESCRRANADYELERIRRTEYDAFISSATALAHLVELAKYGVGSRAVHEASDVSLTVIKRIRNGTRPKIRRETEARILDVTADAIGDGALVDATETQRLIAELVADGYTKTYIARRIGRASAAALQVGKRDKVTALSALRIRRLHAELLAEGDDLPTAKGTPRERILATLKHYDGVAALELFDAMGLPRTGRGTYAKALSRLVGNGVERDGDKYRLAPPVATAIVRANLLTEAV